MSWLSSLSKASEASVASTTEHTSAEKVRGLVVPLDGAAQKPPGVSRSEFLSICNGRTVELYTADGIKLDAVWGVSKTKALGTAIIFHGNGCTLDSMSDYAGWYHERGMNVLCFTMRGYPGSGGAAAKDGELGWYLDAVAAVQHVMGNERIPRDKIICHGYSLGGCPAAAAAEAFGVHLTLDHTFTSLADVGAEVADNISSSIPEFFPRGLFRGAFKKEQVFSANGINVKTDGGNTLEKVKRLESAVFVARGARDEMMPLEFGEKMFIARYGAGADSLREKRLVTIPGGHWGPISSSREASQKYLAFLREQGIAK